MQISYLASSPEAYRGLESKSALDRRRLAALIPYWEAEGFTVRPWSPGAVQDLVYIVSLPHSMSFVQELLNKPRDFAVVAGIIEDPFNAAYANCSSDDPRVLSGFSQYGTGLKAILGCLRFNLARVGLARDYRCSLFELIRRCDGIATTSDGQAALVRQLNGNVDAIPDCMPPTDFRGKIASYDDIEPVRIVWEGTAWGLQLVEMVRPALEAVYRKSTKGIEFVLFAPRVRPSPLYGMRDNEEIMNHRYDMPTRFIEWNLDSYGDVLASASIGIAPMPQNNPFYRNKACSKPLAYMACGLPVVASAIPSYQSLIHHNVDGLIAGTTDEWLDALISLAGSADCRRKIGLAGSERLSSVHSVERTARRFSALFHRAQRL